MAERFVDMCNWDVEDLMYVSVTGMFLTEMAVRMKVGELPKVDFTMNVNAFLNKVTEEELEKLKQLIIKLQLQDLKIGVRTVPIFDNEGNQIEEMWFEE